VKKWIPATLIVALMGAGAGAYLLTREDKHCVPFGTMGKIVDILATQPTEEAAYEITRLLDVNVVAMYQEADGDFSSSPNCSTEKSHIGSRRASSGVGKMDRLQEQRIWWLPWRAAPACVLPSTLPV
jgi:hypothetical protein